MAVTTEQLRDAIETSLNVYPPAPGVMEPLDIPNLMSRVSTVNHPLANLISYAQLTEGNADEVIELVVDRFRGENRAMGWVTGPRSRPTDLAQRLQAHGLVKVDEMAGMVLTDLHRDIHTNPDVRVEEVQIQDLRLHAPLVARSYGLPPEVADWVLELTEAAATRIRIRPYTAYLGDSTEPVSWSTMIYLPDSPIVLLGGAGTLPEARGHGLYTALVARRVQDAAADGREAAVIQAVRSTSAPVAEKLGFQEIADLEFYAWLPEGFGGH